jgi:hypothetical protein
LLLGGAEGVLPATEDGAGSPPPEDKEEGITLFGRGRGGEVTGQRAMEEKGRAHAEQGEELGLEGSQHTLHLKS